jgi:hypothetical protein
MAAPVLPTYTNEDISNAPQNKRAVMLLKARYWGTSMFAAFLFCFSVKVYKQAPNKKKAIFIWDTFLKGGMQTNSAGWENMDLHSLDLTAGDVTQEHLIVIKSWIDAAERMAASARQMNRLVRAFTASDRMMSPVLFDDAVADMFKSGGGGSVMVEARTPIFYAITSARSAEVETAIGKGFLALCQGFRAVGFRLNDVGLA